MLDSVVILLEQRGHFLITLLPPPPVFTSAFSVPDAHDLHFLVLGEVDPSEWSVCGGGHCG